MVDDRYMDDFLKQIEVSMQQLDIPNPPPINLRNPSSYNLNGGKRKKHKSKKHKSKKHQPKKHKSKKHKSKKHKSKKHHPKKHKSKKYQKIQKKILDKL